MDRNARAKLPTPTPRRLRRRTAALWIVLVCALLAPWAEAQTGGWSIISRRDSRDLLQESERQRPGSAVTPASLPLEAAIDPERYVLSPGDLLTLTIWGSVELFYDLTVTSDGVLLVPAVGVVAADGATLADTEARLRERCAEAYPQSQVALSLVRPAVLRIPITGLVQMPGSHQLISSSRLLDLVQTAGGLREGADRRAIEIQRADGSRLRCDLLAWEIDQLAGGNPVLRSGDRVHIRAIELGYRVRGLPHYASRVGSGAASPLEAETRWISHREGDTLDFALRAAGGLGPFFCDEEVRVLRDGKRLLVRIDDASGLRMQPGDVVEVPFCREWVSVGGAVNRPGPFPFMPGQTVADYVYLAGGPNLRGRHSGWQLLDEEGARHSAAPGDSVSAGAQLWVPERRAHTYATILTPIASAVALLVSIVALTR
ncbi:MAG: hypothetical protein GF330_02140 [Candidatus Eisenbacteria bacterium]|nr:hypothetical protein [Candidatus Eisenbacteria bacterium]